jgi:hypothetical protein
MSATPSIASTPIPVMKGGAKKQLIDILQKYAQPLNIYIGILLVLGIVYVGQIPDWITYQANSPLGRLFLFLLTVMIADTYSWIYGLLMALFVVLLIAVAPRTLKAGFQNMAGDRGDTEVKFVSQKKKWWSETVLQENPVGIEEEKVRTSAIQDAGSSSSNSTGSSL